MATGYSPSDILTALENINTSTQTNQVDASVTQLAYVRFQEQMQMYKREVKLEIGGEVSKRGRHAKSNWA